MKLLTNLLSKIKARPIELTEEQFDEAVRIVVRDKMLSGDNSYREDIQLRIRKDDAKKNSELRYFQGKDICGNNYYYEVKK